MDGTGWMQTPGEHQQTPLHAWTGRDVGASGGEHLEWRGRVGLLAGATGELDRHHAVIGALGERWITLRLRESGAREMARTALRREDTEQMRAELAAAVVAYLASVELPELRPLDGDDLELVAALATFAVNARSPVLRDRHSREVELVPQSEGPARLARQLHKLVVALYALGLPRRSVRATLRRIALDSISSPRREALELVLVNREPVTTTEVATRLGLPRTTTERALEDAAALGLLIRSKASSAETSANVWRPSPEALELWDSASPAKSRTRVLREPELPEREIAGEARAAAHSDNSDAAEGGRKEDE